MKRESFLTIAACILAFFVLMFLGMYFSALSDVKSIKVVGVDYASENEIIIELKGEIKSPGKYSVPSGTPLHDVIYMADGLTKDGDPKSVDLGQLMTEPCTVTVSRMQNSDVEVLSKSSFDKDNRCDINSATLKELTSLDGIGEALALDIINYRKVHGKFETVEELRNIKGIGDKKYGKIKDLIKVGG